MTKYDFTKQNWRVVVRGRGNNGRGETESDTIVEGAPFAEAIEIAVSRWTDENTTEDQDGEIFGALILSITASPVGTIIRSWS